MDSVLVPIQQGTESLTFIVLLLIMFWQSPDPFPRTHNKRSFNTIRFLFAYHQGLPFVTLVL